ncbi:winged helix-turn-helix domain-containing protein [Streptosporangium sp. NPDC001681]|uniref:GntR family transcriptional regulator n=1 Tax=Streptosporangium sp. NPDC001681 TaxID=3154395 RepID=UPI00333114F4
MKRRGHRGPVPVYRQIIDAIKADVAAGVLKPGQALPKEAVLAQQHDASRVTVRNALAVLREEGVIYTRHAEGSYIGPEDAPRIREPWPFERVAAQVVELIRGGEYQPDTVLPSENEMMETYGVAKNTVRAAIALLREQGLVYTVPAIGTFVAKRDLPE